MPSYSSVFEEKLASANNYEEVFEFLSFIDEFPPRQLLNIQYVYFQGDFPTFFAKLQINNGSINVLNPNVNAYRFVIKQAENSFKGSFFIQETIFPDLYIFYSISRPNNWNAFLRLVLQRQYPKIVLLFWKQSELSRALRLLEETLKEKYALRIKRLSLKEKRELEKNHKSTEAKAPKAKYDSYLEWTNKTLSQVLDEAKEREQWFKKIIFELFRYKDGIMLPVSSSVCSLSKYGYFSCTSLFHTVFPILRQELEPPLTERIQLFRARGLKERNYKPSTALIIRYPDDIFSDKSLFGQFSSVIKKYPNSTKALFHSNPYFHASIADFLDGSSVDVRISDSRTLLIIPQIYTSINCLERLVAYIFDNFYEGKVEEYISASE
jgi:hypothetical protein